MGNAINKSDPERCPLFKLATSPMVIPTGLVHLVKNVP
jgi:hypothetical protein